MTRPRTDGDHQRRIPVWAETILLLVLALVASAIVKTFFVQMFFVPSGSMRPLFIDDDRILVQKVSYWSGDVQRGDVVVFDDPGGKWLGVEGIQKLTPVQHRFYASSDLRRLPLPAREQPQREEPDRGLRDEHAPEHARLLPVESDCK